jgi:hypothetical protein
MPDPTRSNFVAELSRVVRDSLRASRPVCRVPSALWLTPVLNFKAAQVLQVLGSPKPRLVRPDNPTLSIFPPRFTRQAAPSCSELPHP